MCVADGIGMEEGVGVGWRGTVEGVVIIFSYNFVYLGELKFMSN
jgi:hypothetical protein